MTLVLVSPPDPLISLAYAKSQLRVDTTDDDVIIQLYIDAATSRLDGPNGILGKAFSTQTWSITLDGFTDQIDLPVEPVDSVNSVTYFDSDNLETVMDPGDYYLQGNSLYASSSWPAIYSGSKVTIEWVSGSSEVNPQVQIAAMLIVGHLYRNREATTAENMKELPMGVYDIVSNVRKVIV